MDTNHRRALRGDARAIRWAHRSLPQPRTCAAAVPAGENAEDNETRPEDCDEDYGPSGEREWWLERRRGLRGAQSNANRYAGGKGDVGVTCPCRCELGKHGRAIEAREDALPYAGLQRVTGVAPDARHLLGRENDLHVDNHVRLRILHAPPSQKQQGTLLRARQSASRSHARGAISRVIRGDGLIGHERALAIE